MNSSQLSQYIAGRFADLHGTVAVRTVFRFEELERIRRSPTDADK